MALSKSQLKQRIISELESKGFVTSGEFAMAGLMAEAIANAVVDEIQSNAKALVNSGSSSGNWPVE